LKRKNTPGDEDEDGNGERKRKRKRKRKVRNGIVGRKKQSKMIRNGRSSTACWRRRTMSIG
jgi:hypothetical protein